LLDRKLIFFTTANPRSDPGAFFRVYHFANVACDARGVSAEDAARIGGSFRTLAEILTEVAKVSQS